MVEPRRLVPDPYGDFSGDREGVALIGLSLLRSTVRISRSGVSTANMVCDRLSGRITLTSLVLSSQHWLPGSIFFSDVSIPNFSP